MSAGLTASVLDCFTTVFVCVCVCRPDAVGLDLLCLHCVCVDVFERENLNTRDAVLSFFRRSFLTYLSALLIVVKERHLLAESKPGVRFMSTTLPIFFITFWNKAPEKIGNQDTLCAKFHLT